MKTGTPCILMHWMQGVAPILQEMVCPARIDVPHAEIRFSIVFVFSENRVAAAAGAVCPEVVKPAEHPALAAVFPPPFSAPGGCGPERRRRFPAPPVWAVATPR